MAKNSNSKDDAADDSAAAPSPVEALQRQVNELAVMLKAQIERADAADKRALDLQNREAPRRAVAPDAPEKPARTLPEGPIRVRAVKVGTYPEPGQLRARVRQPGEEFFIQRPEHFAEHGGELINGWMVLAESQLAPAPVVTSVPQTTIPNQVLQDPMGMPAGGAQRLIQS